MKTWTLELIKKAAKEHGIDQALLYAIVMTESSGNPDAKRFEPHYTYLHFPRTYADKLQIPLEEEIKNQMTSWGLCQVMGGVARELNFEGKHKDLLIPEVGIKYGCLKLKEIMQRKSSYCEEDVIVAYNTGNSSKDPKTGMYKKLGQLYLDKVNRHLSDARKLIG